MAKAEQAKNQGLPEFMKQQSSKYKDGTAVATPVAKPVARNRLLSMSQVVHLSPNLLQQQLVKKNSFIYKVFFSQKLHYEYENQHSNNSNENVVKHTGIYSEH